MGYLSFQIIFFLLLAALLGFIIGWLLRGSRFQTELQDLDNRWRTKLGEVEGERDRFVGELTQANDAKAKLETEVRRLSETHESSIQQLKRDHQTKLTAFADADKLTTSLKSDLAARNDELGKVQAQLAGMQKSSGDAGRLGRELATASERAASLESSLRDAKAANATCKSEVDRLKAEVANLQRSGGGGTSGSASSGGAMGLMSNTGSTSGTGTGSGGARGAAGSSGLRSVSGGAGGSSSAGGSDPSYTQRAASPSYLADAGGQGFSSDGKGQSGSGSAQSGKSPADDENEGLQPAALAAARGGQADDLKRISGVGPKLEKTLNGLGIFHFSQIAEFTRDNVAWVDRHLRFKGRIDRENWIDQARILASGGETEFSKRK